MSEYVDHRFDYLIPERESKPRDRGITMIPADGPFHLVHGPDTLEDMHSYMGGWIDWYKWTIAGIAFQPGDVLQEKLSLLDEHGIHSFPGGNFLEAAILEGKTERFLDDVQAVGLPGVEVSTTVADVDLEEKAEIIESATDRGFFVNAEIGEKDVEEGRSVQAMVDEAAVCLDAGAEVVIIDSEELEATFEESPDAFAAVVEAVADEVGQDNLLFELPVTADYYKAMKVSWTLIDALGPDVNIGNVNPNHLPLLEQQRRRLGPYALQDRS